MPERHVPRSTFHIDANGMFVDQPTSQIGSQRNQHCGNRGEIKRPVLHAEGIVVIAQDPVERSEREHHHRQYRVAPGSDFHTDLAHADQVDEPEDTCNPSPQRANARQPEAGAPPEIVESPEIGQVYRQQACQCCDGKVDQHGMQRMPANGRTTVDRLSILGHAALLWLKKLIHKLSRQGAGPLNGAALALAVPLLVACGGPQSALAPASPMARNVANVWWAMFGFSTLVLVVVSTLWIYAMRRRPRHTTDEQAKRIHLRWLIGGGLVLPTTSIVLLLAFGLPSGRSMLPLPNDQALRIEVIGHQWWWEVRYPDGEVITANQLILPVDRPIDIAVTSADVIHSFWVPRLGGKMDMVPGRTNVIRLEASEAGIFRGQCSEFCGTQHAHMILHVEALEEAEFSDWIDARRNLVIDQPPAGEATAVFLERCGQCHRVSGVTEGNRAPDLTDLASRPTLGAGVIVNDSSGLRRWLHEHQNIKHGNAMPRHDDVPDETLEQIADWLETLTP